MSDVILRKYGVEATINFDLFEIDGIDFRIDAAHAAGDTVIMKNEGADASTTNGFTDEGLGYSLVLTSTEMEAARIKVYISDLTATKEWLDKSVTVETYGNASAQHAFDLDLAALTEAEINAQVLDVLNTDTFAEPGDEVPTSTTTLVDKIGYIYKFLRNKVETTEDRIHVYDDAGTNKDQSSVISDSGTLFTRGEFGAGDA